MIEFSTLGFGKWEALLLQSKFGYIKEFSHEKSHYNYSNNSKESEQSEQVFASILCIW